MNLDDNQEASAVAIEPAAEPVAKPAAEIIPVATATIVEPVAKKMDIIHIDRSRLDATVPPNVIYLLENGEKILIDETFPFDTFRHLTAPYNPYSIWYDRGFTRKFVFLYNVGSGAYELAPNVTYIEGIESQEIPDTHIDDSYIFDMPKIKLSILKTKAKKEQLEIKYTNARGPSSIAQLKDRYPGLLLAIKPERAYLVTFRYRSTSSFDIELITNNIYKLYGSSYAGVYPPSNIVLPSVASDPQPPISISKEALEIIAQLDKSNIQFAKESNILDNVESLTELLEKQTLTQKSTIKALLAYTSSQTHIEYLEKDRKLTATIKWLDRHIRENEEKSYEDYLKDPGQYDKGENNADTYELENSIKKYNSKVESLQNLLPLIKSTVIKAIQDGTYLTADFSDDIYNAIGMRKVRQLFRGRLETDLLNNYFYAFVRSLEAHKNQSVIAMAERLKKEIHLEVKDVLLSQNTARQEITDAYNEEKEQAKKKYTKMLKKEEADKILFLQNYKPTVTNENHSEYEDALKSRNLKLIGIYERNEEVIKEIDLEDYLAIENVERIARINIILETIEKTKIRVKGLEALWAGPYQIFLSNGGLQLREKTWSTNKTPHPHARSIFTPPRAISNLIGINPEVPVYGSCLGDAGPSYNYCWATNNFAGLITVVDLWLKSMNSRDYWGKAALEEDRFHKTEMSKQSSTKIDKVLNKLLKQNQSDQDKQREEQEEEPPSPISFSENVELDRA